MPIQVNIRLVCDDNGNVRATENDVKEVTAYIKKLLDLKREPAEPVVVALMLLFGKLFLTRASEGYEGVLFDKSTLSRNYEIFSATFEKENASIH